MSHFPRAFNLLPKKPDLESISHQCDVTLDEIEDIYPCTPLQEGLMAITTQQKNAYIAQITLSIPDSIDLDRFKSAWKCVVQNCAILRTRILFDSSGESIQVLTRYPITWHSGDSLPSYLSYDLSKSMDYGEPLTRFAIIMDKTYDSRIFVWTIHHAIYDGWSIRLIFDHLAQHYNSQTPPPPPPFSLYVQYLQKTNAAECTEFWRHNLLGNNAISWPEAPSQVKVNAKQTVIQSFYLTSTVKHHVTTSTLLQAAWAITLGLHSSSQKVMFAQVLSGRNILLPQATEVVGPMLSTVPIYIELDFSQSVEAFLRKLQIQEANLIKYQHIGLQYIQRLLLASGQQTSPLNNIFVVQPREESGDEAASLGLKEIPGYSMELGIFDTFPVNVQCILKGDIVDVQVAFDDTFVSRETMAHVVSVFAHMSQELATANSNQSLDTLSLIPAGDLSLIQICQKKPPPPVRRCIHRIIEDHVRETPEAIAIHGFDKVLSYAQLGQISDRLAETLIQAGICRGSLVPLCFEKSTWAIVSMLAVLKAGGACVNLDPTHPIDRIRTIIQDTQASVLIVSPAQRARLEVLVPSVIAVDEGFVQGLSSEMPSKLEAVLSHPTDPAFVIYTSGTTGKPKGIVNTHQALATSAAAHGPALGIGPQTRAIQFASYAFDSSIQDISTVLQRGGCVCVISETDRTSNFAAAVRSVKGNYSLLTTSVASLYTPQDLPGIRTLQLGGEPMRKAVLQAWSKHSRVMNTYGPAECSINVTCAADMQADDPENNIGYPVGCRCWVTYPDNANQLVPLGCIGELLVEGPILAREYLREPEKTQAAFIPPPPWRQRLELEPCDRLYRTGDLVFQSANGSFSYVGRKDGQVKLNGQRLEVEEVESLLQQHPSINQAAVVLPQAGPFSKRLVATFTLSGYTESSDDIRLRPMEPAVYMELIESLQTILSKALPASVRVSYFVPVWHVPLTISRKLNRRSIVVWLESAGKELQETLLHLDSVRSSPMRTPQNPKEVAVQRACSRVLGIPCARIDMRKSFFGIGGDSIGAIQLVFQLRAEGFTTTVPDILQASTLADVAHHVETETQSNIAADEPDDTLFNLSPIQKWYFSTRPPALGSEEEDYYYNQSVYGTLSWYVDKEDLRRAISALIDAHPMLRARFQLVDGEWLQAIRPVSHSNFNFRSHTMTDRDSKKLSELAESSHRSLDIINGPILSVDLINFPHGRQGLLLISHHLVIDIVSWTIILDDLDLLLRGNEILIREQTSFQSWCRFRYETLSNCSVPCNDEHNDNDTDLTYWGLSAQDRITNGSLKIATVVADSDTTSLFLGDINNVLRTEPVDLLLSAVCMSFFNTFPGRQELHMFNESHGREIQKRSFDLSRTVGWFTVIEKLSFSRTRASDLTATIQTAKELRKLANTETFARRCVHSESKRKQPMEILFNYHGSSTLTDSADKAFNEESMRPFATQDQGPAWPISALFEVGVTVGDGVTEFTVYWPAQLLHQERIVEWIDSIPDSLRLIAIQLAKEKTQAFSLSDFQLLNLNYTTLDRLQHVILPQIRSCCHTSIQDVVPCSPMQDGMLLAQMKKNESYYQISQEYEIRLTNGAPLDVHKLGSAWKRVVSRHTSLRTVFIESVDNSSAFSQVVLVSFEPEIIYLDDLQKSSELPPVDYSQLRPPHRLILAPAMSGAVVCLLEISHAITDATSTSILLRDWAQAYDRTTEPTEENQTTYADFIKHICSISHQERLDYWTTYLANAEPCYFPSMSTVISSVQYHTAVIDISQHDSTRIRQYCSQVGVGLATLFQAAWSIVLAQYTGADDVCFGYLASGRDAPVPGIDEAVGVFVNMLICRVQFSSSSMTVSQYLRGIQHESVNHLRFQHCTLAEIHHALEIPHGRALFNTIMSYQSDTVIGDNSQSLEFIEKNGRDPTEFDLSLGITSDLEKVQLSLDYRDAFISTQQASTILSSFQCAVIALVNDPKAPIDHISLLSECDLETIKEWNGPFPVAEKSCVHTVITANAKSSPNAPAVCSFDENLSYGELEEISNHLAKFLIIAGIGLEQMVPLCFDKSTWAVVSMLAVLKAGGVCVSLGPATPTKQLHDTLDNIQASIILLSPQHVDLFKEVAIPKIVIDRDFIMHLRTCYLHSLLPCSFPEISPQNAAFVIFTSGSTGTPKGIVLEHSSVVTSSKAHGSAMGITNTSRVLQFSAYTFDVSIQDIFTTWQRGGCVCIISEHERLNDLTNAINARQANFADLTPTIASLLRPSLVPCLKTISIGGEIVPRSLNESWQQYTRVVNLYGPAETTINAAFTDKTDRESEPASIGRPLSSWFWIADPKNADVLVPIGCVGELLIEGPLLARGYLNNKAKTDEAFITNAKWWQDDYSYHAENPSRRIYKTGDLVRLNHDGTYTYIGRKDRQVKIHGQRIEMDAIDHCLQKLVPDNVGIIAEAVGNSGTKQKCRLAAFLEWNECLDEQDCNSNNIILPVNDDIALVISELRNSLHEFLPPHMHPSFYVPLRRFPLTVSGKVDRKKIVALVENMSLSEQNQVATCAIGERQAPTTQVQEILLSLIVNLLALPPNSIGVDDSFFALGGDSVKGIKLAQEARNLGLSLSVADILRYPRIKDLSDAVAFLETNITQPRDDKYDKSLTPRPFSLLGKTNVVHLIEDLHRRYPMLSRNQISDIMPVTDFQALSVALGQGCNRGLMPYFSWQRVGLPDLTLLKNTCQSLVTKFDSLRTAFVFHGSQCLQVVLKDLDIDIPVYETEDELADFTLKLRSHDMHHPPALGEPVTRFAIVHQTRHNQYRLVIRLSHAQYDGMSIHRMWDAIDAAIQGRQYRDNSANTSFAPYMHSLADIDREKAYTYWRDLLKNSSMYQFTSRAHPSLGYSSTMLNFSRTIDLPSFISHKWSFATILNACWAYVLSKLSSQDDVVFGSIVNGRNLPGAEDVFGACVNCIPIRVKIPATGIAEDIMEVIHKQKIAGESYETIGYREIIKFSTDWPSCHFFSSLVIHQNTESHVNNIPQVDDLDFHFDVTGWESDLIDVTIESIPLGNSVDISIYCRPSVLSADLAKELHEQLCETVFRFCHNPRASLVSPSGLGDESPFSQFALSPTSSNNSLTTQSDQTDVKVLEDFQNLLRSLWMKALGPMLLSGDWAANSSFFAIGGDLIAACNLAEELNFHGVKCTIDDLVNHHTWAEQLRFLSSL